MRIRWGICKVPGIQQCSADIISFSSLFCLPKDSVLVGMYPLSFYFFNEYLLNAIFLFFLVYQGLMKTLSRDVTT